jgi:hypothetical protein
MTGRNSAVSSASPPKLPSKSSRNAPHPTTRQRPCETRRPFGRESRAFFVSVVADAFAGALTRGSFKTIPASEETTNTQRFEADSLGNRSADAGKVLWCITRPDLFAPALAQAGLVPDRVIYVEAGDETSVLVCFEEGLRHGGLGAVVAEVARLSMTASRRLQLAAARQSR